MGKEIALFAAVFYLCGIACKSCLERWNTNDVATIPCKLVLRLYTSGEYGVRVTNIYKNVVKRLGFFKIPCVELEDMPTCDAVRKACLSTYRIEIALSTHSFGIGIDRVVGKHTFALIIRMGNTPCYIEVGTAILEAQLSEDMSTLSAGLVVVLVFVAYPKA